MAGSTPASATASAAAPRPRIGPWQEAWRRFRKHRLAVISAGVLAALIVAVVIGPLVWTLPIDEIDFTARLQGPSWAHPLGTDDLGQDLLARILYGGRISLAVGFAAMAVAIFVGVLVGAIAGMAGGAVDAALMWVTDLFLSLPQLPLLLLIIYLFRDTLTGAGRAGIRRLHPGGRGDRRLPLDAGGAPGARAVPLPAREGIRRGRARARCLPPAPGAAPHPAQCARPGDRGGEHRRRRRDHRRNRRCPSSASAFRPMCRPGGGCCSTPRTISTSHRIGRCSPAPRSS